MSPLEGLAFLISAISPYSPRPMRASSAARNGRTGVALQARAMTALSGRRHFASATSSRL
jgi:hypothetical protein